MGRGRAKAKQTKVARRLKYQQIDTDYAALQRELGGDDSADKPDDDDADDDYGHNYRSYVDDGEDEARRAG